MQPLLLVFTLVLFAVGSTTATCSGLGTVTDGTCNCDPGFKGEQCAQLDLAPAPSEGALHLANHRSSWGGRPIKIGAQYHLYVSDVGPCGTGQLLVYYIGSRWNASEPPNCSKNAPDQPPDDVLANINVAYSPSGNPSGPWEYHTNVFPNNTRAGIRWVTAVTNPAPLVLPNGTALMAFHGVEPKGTAIDGVGGEAPGIAVAESWRGPFRLLNKEPIFNSLNPYVALNGTAGQAVFRGEDFFLWQDTVPGRGWYHLLWHVKQPFAYESSGWKMSGSMAWSIDGVHWTPCATEAYNNSPEWVPAAAAGTVDGTRGGVGGGDLRWTMHNLTSRQRPLLHFGDVTNPGRPTHLYNGVQNCSQDTCNGIYDYSWNAVIPFK
eukprot:gene4680-9723_t